MNPLFFCFSGSTGVYPALDAGWGLVQKITLEGKPENAELLKKGLKDEVVRFEEIIENLKKGSRELRIRPLTKHEEGAVLIFDNIVNGWNLIFKPALLDIITLPSPKKEIQEYDNLINAYVEKINNFVKHIETDHEDKVSGFTFFTFSAVFVFSVTAAVIIIYIRRSIVSPLKTLNDAVNNIENKKFNICVDVKSRDELGHLGNAFNSMAQRLGALCAEKAMLIQSLEDKVRERTKDLEAALIQADAANRAKTDFLANMSHELRTPLNSVIGFSELLLESEPDSALTDKQKKFLNYINESGELNEVGEPKIAQSDITPAERHTRQIDIFTTQASPIIKELLGIDVLNMTPLEALNKLHELKKKLQ